MSSITLQMTPQQITQVQAAYQDYLDAPVAHAHFRARKNKTVITAYQSGKVLFQGVQALEEAAYWEKEFHLSQSMTPSPKFSSRIQEKTDLNKQALDFDQMTLIGADEAGTGDFFGPTTFCAAYVPKNQVALLKEYGVKDSKTLSDAKIQEIANLLVKTIPFHITVISPSQYNLLQPIHNANGVKAIGHNRTLLSLWHQLSPSQQADLEKTVLDEFAKPSLYQKYIQKEKVIYPQPVTFIQKGESHSIAVAAASILARAAFIQQMNALGQPYGQPLPLGAGPKVDAFGKRLVTQYGEEILKSLTKEHFANTQKILGK